MYMLVATSPASTINRLTLNTFVPSFIAMAQVIFQMNNLMSNTHRFLQSAPDWSPYLALAFYGNLFIIQALRAQREISPLPMHENWLLDTIIEVIGLDALIVPGPLIPFFQALAASSAPFEWFGNIAPSVIGILTGCNQDNDYVLPNNYLRLLPNVPMYLDMLARVSNLDPDSNSAAKRSVMNQFYRSIFTVDCTNAASDQQHISSLGLPARPFAVSNRITTVEALLNLDLPTRLDRNGADTTDLQLIQFMRLFDAPTVANGRYHTWFEQAAGIQARYAQFFKGSVPLSAITPVGIGSCITVVTYAANNARLTQPWQYSAYVPAVQGGAAAQRAYFTRLEVNSLNARMSHSDHALEEIAEQCGQIAAVNVSLTTAGFVAPTDAQIRTGHVWTLPDIRQTQQYDIAPGIYSRLVSSYHEDTRNTH